MANNIMYIDGVQGQTKRQNIRLTQHTKININ